MKGDKAGLWKVQDVVGHLRLFQFEVLVWCKIKCVIVGHDLRFVRFACLLDAVVNGRVSRTRWESDFRLKNIKTTWIYKTEKVM